jgi:cytochrome c556
MTAGKLTIIVLSAIALLLGAPVWSSAASMTNDQLVAARVAAMKEDGRILRGAASLTGAEAVAAATTVLKNFTNFPSLFKPGSITPDSRATPAIWENWADFTARMNAEKANATAMLAAAKSGDTGAYKAAVDALKAPCSNCHLAYARVF